MVNHKVATRRGIMYETVSPLPHGVVGRCDADTFVSRDYLSDHPIHHIGHDWEGRLWFGDIYEVAAPHMRHIAWLPRVRPERVNPFALLTGGFQMHGRNQRSHVHATLMPDRRSILFTGPDDESRTNHIFLLGVADLAEAETEVIGDGCRTGGPDLPKKGGPIRR